MVETKKIAGLVLLVVAVILLINSISGIFFPLTIAGAQEVRVGEFDPNLSAFWTEFNYAGCPLRIYIAPESINENGVFAEKNLEIKYAVLASTGNYAPSSGTPKCNGENMGFVMKIDGTNVFSQRFDTQDYRIKACDNWDNCNFFGKPLFQSINVSSFENKKHSLEVYSLSGQLVLSFYFTKQSELCSYYDTSKYVLEEASFVAGQTIKSETLATAFGNQEIKAFCPKDLPAIVLNSDTNEIIGTSVLPYESASAGNYYTVPANAMVVLWAITTRPNNVSWQCDINYYHAPDDTCKPVPAIVFNCILTGQVSSEEGYCITEETPKCTDKNGNIVANAVFNADRNVCDYHIPLEGTVDVPEGCHVTEYDSSGRPIRCEFQPSAGCAIGTVTQLPNGSTVCKYRAPTQTEIIVRQINLLQLIVSLILLGISIVLVI